MTDNNVLIQPLYSPISHESMRLLEIQGTTLTPPELSSFRDLAICCSLQTVSIDEVERGDVSYAALSYVWGATEPRRYILCDGHLKSVTPNLYDVLWELARGKYELPRRLWIDAVCINQDDIEERSSQVQLMGRTYSKADLVLVWLGTPSATMSKNLQLFWAALNSQSQVDSIGDRPFTSTKLNVVSDVIDPKLTEMDQAGRHFFETCGWFTRMWTFQEICLAKRAVFLCNRCMIPWDGIAAALPHEEAVRAILSIKKAISTGQSLRLNALLRLTASRNAVDSRDYLYGVLGLYRGARPLTADYRKSDLEVRAMLFQHLARDCNPLNSKPNSQSFFPLCPYEEDHWRGIPQAQSWIPPWGWLRTKGRTYAIGSQKPTVPRISHEGLPTTNIQVRGALCAIAGRAWDTSHGPGLWLPKCYDFPPCITTALKRRMESDNDETASKCYDASETCALMYDHRSRSCGCTSSKGIHNGYLSTLEREISAGNALEDGWVCQILDLKEPIVLWPYFDAQRRGVLFAVRYTHPHRFPPRGSGLSLYAPVEFELTGDITGINLQDLNATYEHAKLDRQR